MEIDFVKHSKDHVIFELKNADVSFANALRRIMLGEVPTMAIEYIDIEQNDSPIHDEVLAHRLGLLPIRADAEKFEPCLTRDDINVGVNAVEFVLDFTAGKKGLKPDGTVHVLTKFFQLVGNGSKIDGDFDSDKEEDEQSFIHQDIVVAKLKPGESIKLRCYATKGIGEIHTKWSPVGTASYRATPLVEIKEPIVGDEAINLKKLCPKNVFDIEDGEAYVANMKACSICRACVSDLRWKNNIVLDRVKDSFCFSVESIGSLTAEEIVRRSVKVLREKCTNLQELLE